MMRNYSFLLLLLAFALIQLSLQGCCSKRTAKSDPPVEEPSVPPVPDISDDLPIGVPAIPGVIHYALPDGYILLITLHGDEHGHIAKTADGFPIIMNSEGYYEYALYDDQGLPQPTGIIARNPDDRTEEDWRIIRNSN